MTTVPLPDRVSNDRVFSSALARPLIDEWDRLGEPFQDFLAAHGLSSNMWLVASRR